MSFRKSPRSIQSDIAQCESSTPPAVFSAIRRYELSLAHKKLSPRSRQSIQMKLAELKKKVEAGKLDCVRRAKHTRAIQDAQSKSERRRYEAESKSAKYQTQQQKATLRHEKKVQSLERAKMRQEAGVKSTGERAGIAVGIMAGLGGLAWLMMG